MKTIAQGVSEPRGGITNPALGDELNRIQQYEGGVGFLGKLFPAIIGLILVVGAVGFFFMLVVGAIQWIFSGGDKASIESARGRITSALIGIILLFSAFVIATVVENFFGVNILTIDIGPLKIQ